MKWRGRRQSKNVEDKRKEKPVFAMPEDFPGRVGTKHSHQADQIRKGLSSPHLKDKNPVNKQKAGSYFNEPTYGPNLRTVRETHKPKTIERVQVTPGKWTELNTYSTTPRIEKKKPKVGEDY